jgi:predicted nucleic acid-binding Zn ribbon protein
VSKPLCPICNSPLLGRSDKKYCSDQCRYLANNKIKIQTERPILEINKALRQNRSILKKLCPIGKVVVRKEVLVAMGYEVAVFSSLFVTSNKQVYYICYDYAFTPLLERNVEKALIVTRQDYMNGWDPWRFVKKKS